MVVSRSVNYGVDRVHAIVTGVGSIATVKTLCETSILAFEVIKAIK